MLSTILTGNTFVNFAIASLGYLLLYEMVPQYSEAISVPLWTLLLLMFGEIGPKQFAMRHAEELAPLCVRLLKVFAIILKPFTVLMRASSSVFGKWLERERRALSDDELRTVIERAATTGVLDSEEASMMEGVMRLPDLYALNEMTPRVKLVGVESSDTNEEKLAVARATDYPYLPVYNKDFDHIEGFLDVQAFLSDPAHNAAVWTRDALRVSEHESLDDVLVLFVKTGRRIAVVTDRWGGTAGIITRGDILELIVKPVEED